MQSDTIRRASELWDYLSSFESVAAADAIVVCCSYDLRVCDHACDLVKRGISERLVLSGNTGHWTRHIWSKPEAYVFRDHALKVGVPDTAILVEDEATNFGENIAFSRNLLPDARSVVLVTKPAAVLRLRLAAEAQWTDADVHVSCPRICFPDEVSNVVGVLGVIDEMVGDVERIREYPNLGYQVPHELPPGILDAWEYLLAQGFTNHLMQESLPER